MEKQRTVASIVLIAVGAALLLYGLSTRAGVEPSSDEPSQVQAQAQVEVQAPSTPESPVAQEQAVVAKDDVKQEEPAEVKKPAGETKKAPAACPT